MNVYETGVDYSIDVNLFEYINSNENLTEEQKSTLYDMLNVVKHVYDMYINDYTFDHVSQLIKTLKIVEKDENTEISYDRENNELILGKSPNNREYNSYKALFEFTSQRHNKSTDSYTSGIIVKSDTDEEYGKNLNDLIISKLITYTTGYSKREESIAQNDEILKYVTDIVGAEKLISCFAYGNGKLLFAKLFQKDKGNSEKKFV